MRRKWQDDLPPIIIATAVQFGVLRAVDWAKAAQETNENARRLVENHYYFAPQIIAVVIGWLLVKLVRDHLDLRGTDLSDWLFKSAFFLFVGGSIIVVAHLDQILGFLASVIPSPALKQADHAFAIGPGYDFFRSYSMARWLVDIVGLSVCLLGLRTGKMDAADAVTAKDVSKTGNWIKAGEMYLKTKDYRRAKAAFKKANAPARVAAIEMAEGNARTAAKLYEEAGATYAWEAAACWTEAGEEAKADEAKKLALLDARSSARWDRLNEVGDALGDMGAIAEACRRLAELSEPGLARTALWKRAGDASKAGGNVLEAAEAYRAAGEPLLAGECFLQGGRPKDAAQDFERAGDLARAAAAAAQGGLEREAREYTARDAEGRGDLAAAAEAWRLAGNTERAANLFEKKGLLPRAAATWREAGRLDRAALLYERAGDQLAAAAAYELSGNTEKAAGIYRQLGDHERAAALFKGSGKWLDSAAALEQAGQFEEAAAMFARAGRGFDAARCALMAGKREQAWEHLVGVPRSEPRIKEFFVKLAEAHLAAGEARDAVHVLRELLGPQAVNKENVAAQYLFARALAMAGDALDASDRMARVSAFDPQYVAAREVRAVPVGIAETRRMPPNAHTPPHVTPPGHIAAAPNTVAAQGVTPGPLSSFARTPVPGYPPNQPVTDASGSFPIGADTPEMRYEIVSELGRGGMGVVHKALDRKLDRYVALKILPWQSLGDETALRYFSREAKAIAQLKHPNIVGLYDYGRGWGSLYLAMEYLDGPNLQSLMKSDVEKLKKHWRKWFVEATRGVAAAHTKGILHRDVKPANLMLDEHGILRILDFGLARPESDYGATSKLIGTPAFFPPEVLRGEAPTPASDVYSLGATFYTLATGRWPYVGDDVLVARLEREPDDPRPYAPHLTEDEIYVLMKSLARHRPERYPDAGELLGALLSLEG